MSSLFQKVMSADTHFTPTVMLKVQVRQDGAARNRAKTRLYLDRNAPKSFENR